MSKKDEETTNKLDCLSIQYSAWLYSTIFTSIIQYSAILAGFWPLIFSIYFNISMGNILIDKMSWNKRTEQPKWVPARACARVCVDGCVCACVCVCESASESMWQIYKGLYLCHLCSRTNTEIVTKKANSWQENGFYCLNIKCMRFFLHDRGSGQATPPPHIRPWLCAYVW